MATERLDQNPGMQAIVPQVIEDVSVDLRHFVLFAEPMREIKARDWFLSQGFMPWVPLYNKTSIYHVRSYGRSVPRSRTAPAPIFTGLLFLPLNVAWGFGPVEDCPYLRQSGSKFLKNKRGYKVLSANDLAEIRQCEAVANFQDAYKIGDEVIVLDGPFAERVANINKLDDAERIELLMDIFGRKTTIFASASQIAKPK